MHTGINPFSLLAYTNFLLSLSLAVYVLRLDRNNIINRVFTLLAAVTGIWSLGYVFIYPGGPSDYLWFWYRFTSIGWILMPGLALIFAVYVTGLVRRRSFLNLMWAGFLAASALFLTISFTGILIAGGFEAGPYGTLEVHASDRPVYWLYISYNILSLFSAFFIVLSWVIRTRRERVKRQGFYIIAGYLSTFVLIYGFNVIIPNAGGMRLPALGATTLFVFNLLLWLAIRRYGLFRLTPEYAAPAILSRMTDAMFLLSPEGRVTLANKRAMEYLGLPEQDVLTKGIENFFSDPATIRGSLARVVYGGEPFVSFESSMLGRNQTEIPVSAFLTSVRDRTREALGYVLFCRDMSETILLREATNLLASERSRLKKQNAAMRQEIELAMRIQQRMIPSEIPLEGMAAMYKPMEQLGGDFYDFVSFGKKTMAGIFLSDVSGHGVPAAFVTTMIKSYLGQVGALVSNPSEVLSFMNSCLTEQTGGNFVTAFYAILDLSRKELVYCNAGHPSPLLVRDGQVSELPMEGRSLPLAVAAENELVSLNKPFRDNNFKLKKGDVVLFYTDGLSEARPVNKEAQEFGEMLLPAVLAKSGLRTPREVIDAVTERLASHMAGERMADDVCMICLKVN